MTSNEIADEAVYWRELWQKTANGLLGAQAEIERLTAELAQMTEVEQMQAAATAHAIHDLEDERDDMIENADQHLADVERLVSRNAQLEEESLKRDTELRMERDTNTEHCKARVALEAEIERLRAELADKALADSAIANIRKLCHEIMGGNCSFVDDDFGRALITLRDERDRLRHDIERHIAIASEHATESDRLRGLLMDKCPCGRPGSEHIIECPPDAGVSDPPKSSPVGS